MKPVIEFMQQVSFRMWASLGVLMSILSMLVVVFYFEYALGLEPCPLCVLQRMCTIGMGVVALVAVIHNPSSSLAKRIYFAVAAIPVICGISIAGRHVWLQNLPKDRVPECGPGYDFIMDTFPFLDALEIIFRGSGECADTQWQFLGLTIPGWALVFFVGLLLVLIYLAVRVPRTR